jgi:hypothetical protein
MAWLINGKLPVIIVCEAIIVATVARITIGQRDLSGIEW